MPTLKLRAPFDGASLLAYFAARRIAGVEEVGHDTYTRALRLPDGPAVLRLRMRAASVVVEIDGADDATGLELARHICDARADPAQIATTLGADPLLAPLVAARPGLRAPGAADGHELLIRAITGQQVSVAGAHTTLSRMVAAHGRPLPASLRTASITHTFPAADALAAADPTQLGMPHARGRAIVAASAADLTLEPGVDLAATRAALLALPGVGPWTADYVAMRALRDPDVFLAGDLGVRHALKALNAPEPDHEAWAPYRTYATHHLWRSLSSG